MGQSKEHWLLLTAIHPSVRSSVHISILSGFDESRAERGMFAAIQDWSSPGLGGKPWLCWWMVWWSKHRPGAHRALTQSVGLFSLSVLWPWPLSFRSSSPSAYVSPVFSSHLIFFFVCLSSWAHFSASWLTEFSLDTLFKGMVWSLAPDYCLLIWTLRPGYQVQRSSWVLKY